MSDEDVTPAQAARRERRTLRNMALSFTDIGSELADVARSLSEEPDDYRLRSALLGIAERLAHVGDSAHLARHALRDLALWAPGQPVDAAALAELIEVSKATAIPRERSLRVTAPVLPAWKRFVKRLLKL